MFEGFLTFLAPMMLLLPAMDAGDAPVDEALSRDPAMTQAGDQDISSPLRHYFVAPIAVPVQHQVRIEQRVIIRISPRVAPRPNSLLAELPQSPPPPRYVERKMADCIAIKSIAGVQTQGAKRLILYLRDRRMVRATLEKSCLARDFYSGFYIERSEDGMLCINRDRLQSRAGTSCAIGSMRQLVAVRD